MAWFPCKIGGGSDSPIETKELIYSIDESQGGVWVNSNIDITQFIELYFRYTDSVSGADYTAIVKVEDIAVYTGGADVFTTVFPSAVSVLQFNVRIYNNELYVSFNGVGANTRAVGVYKKITVKGNATVKQGTFVSASSQYGIVDVDCGFEPDLVMVKLPFTGGDTVSYWEKGLSYAQNSAIWCLVPAESVAYDVALGRVDGETGIQQINNDGFSFMSNGWNTQGVTCQYVAIKYEAEPQPEPEDRTYLFKDGEWKNQTILTITTNSTTIEDGKLKCTGTFSGIVVSDVSGLDTNDTTYNLYFKLTNSDVGMVQNGRCNPTQNLSDIIQYGTDRISYNNDYLAGNTNYEYMLTAMTKTSGVFFGNASSGGTMYIDEIWIDEIQSEFAIRG